MPHHQETAIKADYHPVLEPVTHSHLSAICRSILGVTQKDENNLVMLPEASTAALSWSLLNRGQFAQDSA